MLRCHFRPIPRGEPRPSPPPPIAHRRNLQYRGDIEMPARNALLARPAKPSDAGVIKHVVEAWHQREAVARRMAKLRHAASAAPIALNTKASGSRTPIDNLG